MQLTRSQLRPVGIPEAYHFGMHGIRNEGVLPGSSDGSIAVELLLRQEPDDDEKENRKDDNDDVKATGDGYLE